MMRFGWFQDPDNVVYADVEEFAEGRVVNPSVAIAAHDAGIDVLATHVGPKDVIPFLKDARGQKFLADCRRYGIGVEHELHALEYLLPRALFASEPELFRILR